ncbi:MAG TPA: hypothetical protein VE218_01570 [Acidobacteriaceae bacterium]|nr:hypothetical protein [Acidobacteriaceae bacterium]
MPKIQSTHNARPGNAQDGVRLSISPAHKVGNKIGSDLPLRRPSCPGRNIAGIRETHAQVERHTASKQFPQPFFGRTQSSAPLHQLTHGIKRADLHDPREYTVHSCHVLKGDTAVARETEKCAEQPCRRETASRRIRPSALDLGEDGIDLHAHLSAIIDAWFSGFMRVLIVAVIPCAASRA